MSDMWQSLQIKDGLLQPLQNPSTAALTSSKSMSPPPPCEGGVFGWAVPCEAGMFRTMCVGVFGWAVPCGEGMFGWAVSCAGGAWLCCSKGRQEAWAVSCARGVWLYRNEGRAVGLYHVPGGFGCVTAEVAQQLARNVNFEIPALKRQIARCVQSSEDCARKEVEYTRSSAELRDKFAVSCKQMGIEVCVVRPIYK